MGHAGAWQKEGNFLRVSQGNYALNRLVPGVERKVERSPVNGHEKFAAQQLVRVQGVIRAHMDVGPLLTVGAYFEQGEIKRTEALADFAKAIFERAGIGAEVDVMGWRLYGEGRPECFIAIKCAAP